MTRSSELIDTAITHHERLQYLKKSREEISKAVEGIKERLVEEKTVSQTHIVLEAENAMDDLRDVNDDGK